MSENESDPELVERSLRGDQQAFTRLVERHKRLVFGVALSSARDAALAEDVAQEAFVEAWRDLRRLRDPGRVGSWIAGIARHLARSVGRTAARRRALREAHEPPAAAPAATPLDALLAEESHAQLSSALADVPAAYREVLVLYHVHGQSIAEVAAGLGVNEALVKQRLVRGRRALRAHLEARVEDALASLRPGKAFTVTVMAAVATATARQAAAATSAGAAGKVFMGLSTSKLVLLGGAVVVASGVGWIGWRGERSQAAAAPAVARSAEATPAATAAAPAAPAVGLTARRLPDPAARERLLGAVRHAQATRRAPAAAPPAAAPPGPAAATDDGEDLDKVYVRAAVQAILPLVSECYDAALARTPGLAGRLVVDFTIEGEPDVGGLVTASAIHADGSDIVDAEMRQCVQETMFALAIDPPASGVVQVTYPFEFAP